MIRHTLWFLTKTHPQMVHMHVILSIYVDIVWSPVWVKIQDKNAIMAEDKNPIFLRKGVLVVRKKGYILICSFWKE